MIWKVAEGGVYLKKTKSVTFGIKENEKYFHTMVLKDILDSRGYSNYLAPMELAAWKN